METMYQQTVETMCLHFAEMMYRKSHLLLRTEFVLDNSSDQPAENRSTKARQPTDI